MAQNLNRVQLVGHLGKDPEVRQTPQGTTVCNFTLATTESYKDRTSNEWKDITDWHRVQAWDRLADNVSKYLKKGSKVFIEGKLKTRSYEQDGTTRYITEVRADNIIFMSESRGDGPPAQSGSSSYGSKSDSSYSQPEPSYEEPQSNADDGDDDDDVPF